jgi:hypothetical protein
VTQSQGHVSAHRSPKSFKAGDFIAQFEAAMKTV